MGVINGTGLGKTRHIDTSLLWIQQTAAERRLAFAKVLGKNNPADLYTKYLDLNTSDTHVKTLNYQFAEGRSSEAPKLHLISHSWRQHMTTKVHLDWKWLQAVTEKKGLAKAHRGDINLVTRTQPQRLTGSGPWVLRGSNWPVQGFNGSNAAQLSQPRGSTLTFQRNAGVSYGTGLRHG